jgi:hypothetical protein
LTVHEYCNEDKGYSNPMKKKIRVQELLDATFAAKEQAQAIFQELSRKLKKATDDRKACGTRLKYLADVAKREFGITKSNKRKISSDSSLIHGVLGTFHDFRPKKQRFDDFGEYDEEKFPVKEELPKKEEIVNGSEVEDPDGQRLKASTKGLIPGNWRTSTVKQGIESQSSVSPDYFPKKREPSTAPRVSLMFQPTIGRQQSRRRGDEYMEFREDMSSSGITEASRNEDEEELKNQQFTTRYSVEASPLRGRPFQRPEAYLTRPSILRIPKTAKDSTWAGRHTDTTTPDTAKKDGLFPAHSPRTSGSEPAILEPDGFVNDLSEMWGSNAVEPDTAASNANDAEPAPGVLDAGDFQSSKSEARSSNNFISVMNHSGCDPSKSLEHNAAEMQHDVIAAGDADDAGDAGEDIDDVDLATFREHKRRIKFGFLYEGYNVTSRAAASELANSEDDDDDDGDEDAHMPIRRKWLVTHQDSDDSESGTSGSSSLPFLVSDIGSPDANDSSIPSGSDGGDSDASDGSEKNLIEVSTDDETD